MSVRRKLNEWVGGVKVVCKWKKEAERIGGGIKEKKTSVWILRKKRGWLIESSEKEEKEWMKK